MAPLRTKLGDTFHKLSDRLNKRGIPEDAEGSHQSKQLRTSTGQPFEASSQDHSYSANLDLLDLQPRQSVQTETNSSILRGSTVANPIDLTDDSFRLSRSNRGTLASHCENQANSRDRPSGEMTRFNPLPEGSGGVLARDFRADQDLAAFWGDLQNLRCKSFRCGSRIEVNPERALAHIRACLSNKSRTRGKATDTNTPTADATPKPDPTSTTLGKLAKPFSRRPTQQSKLSQGTGYGGAETPYVAVHFNIGGPKIVSPKPLGISKEDEELRMQFLALSKLLARTTQPSVLSFNPEPKPRGAVAEMVMRSPLLPKAAELLRQHCIEELGLQHLLYSALMKFFYGMASDPDVRPLLFRPLALLPESEQLAAFTLNSRSELTTTSAHDTTHSLYHLLQQLASFYRFYIARADLAPHDFEGEFERNTLALGKQISHAASHLGRMFHSMPAIPDIEPPAMSDQAAAPLANVTTRAQMAKMAATATLAAADKLKQDTAAWHREHCVEELPDDKIMEGFHFCNKAKAITATQAKGRMKSLVAQITSLRVDLPEGIYVRHGASRLDVMKVLMVGPSGTPYENGLFEFDMFCGQDFPQKPPEMQFRTTGGGRVHFNPNLYSNGKVCLSLLGTWQGQSWEIGKSTILQVLVSIQGMIFNAKPWYNEPGREYHLNPTASNDYNATTWKNTIQYATLHWLRERLAEPLRASTKGKQLADVSLQPGMSRQGASALSQSTKVSSAGASSKPPPAGPSTSFSNGSMSSASPFKYYDSKTTGPLYFLNQESSLVNPSDVTFFAPVGATLPVQQDAQAAPSTLPLQGTAESTMKQILQLQEKLQSLPQLKQQLECQLHLHNVQSAKVQAELQQQIDELRLTKQVSQTPEIQKLKQRLEELKQQAQQKHFLKLQQLYELDQDKPQMDEQLLQLHKLYHQFQQRRLDKELKQQQDWKQQLQPQLYEQPQMYPTNPMEELWMQPITHFSDYIYPHMSTTHGYSLLQSWGVQPPAELAHPPPAGTVRTNLDRLDDGVWGDMIRKHFSTWGPTIVKTAEKSPYNTPAASVKELKEEMMRHGFCADS